jgi:hypothetical protein
MRLYLFTFSHRGYTVTSRIMARSAYRASRIARERERTWRLAVDQYLKEYASWS